MNAALVDTSFWYALFDDSDSHHVRAQSLWKAEARPPIITQPCLVELVTILSNRADPAKAVRVGRFLRSGSAARILDIIPEDEAEGFRLIEKFIQQRLSYADATACALVRRLDIPRVLAFDHDYRVVLPEREVVGPE